jgi:anthranilate synthase component 1
MEMCIAIRMLIKSGDRLSAQAGAGIVFDSKPAAEYAETVNKAKALFVAVAEASTRPPGRSLAARRPRRKRRRR